MDFSKIRNYLFLGLLGVVTVLFLFLLKPFAYPLLWAAIVAGLFYPVYRGLNNRLKHGSLSSILTLMLVAVIILVPLAILAVFLTAETLDLYAALRDNRGQIGGFLQSLAAALEANPTLAALGVTRQAVLERMSEAGGLVANFTFQQLRALTQNSVVFIAQFVIMLYTLFFFLRDGERILQKLMFLMPLGDKQERLLYKKFTTAARAAIKGTILIGTIQGALGGLVFSLTGVPGALLLAILMTLLAMIPGVGAAVVWLPVGLALLLIGKLSAGIIILLVGALIISTVDNLLRPILVGKDLQMHPLLILFSTLGGLALFGISGFIIGPIVAALFLAFWEMYEENYRSDLSHN
ncbi:MAG: AI-2E family transporter [Candidatus Magasanikbacteria bacterium]|nr:AI-2E family transporter [Candidatus Magasanikbacteria bacterium]